MAANKMKHTAASAEPQTFQLRPAFITSEDTPQYYVNHAEINANQHEFTITLGRIPSRLTPSQAEQARTSTEVSFPADLQLLVPPTMIAGLIDALRNQKEFYEKSNAAVLKAQQEGT